MINVNHISSIFITKFNVLEYRLDADAYNKEEPIKYGHRISNLLLETSEEKDKNEAKVKLSLDFSFKFENKDAPTPFMLLTTSSNFVMPLSILNEYTENIDNKNTINEVFINYIYKLVYDTSRGILISKTEGTSFSKFIMPHLPITNSGAFEIEKEEPIM